MSRTKDEINNEVLGRLWNDPDVRILNRSADEIMPGHIAANEMVVDDDHLTEAGYVGELPKFHIRIGKFLIFRATANYEDYWIRIKQPRKESPNLYSIFKER
ncbi:MAG: hypothetical protein QOH41_1700 [Blastocatellia bacterium]|jgi:hypothetical protein|nr:hypothetical protein [Blastocatellia bacterium]